MTYKHFIQTAGSVVVIFDTGQMPIPVENPMYQKVVDALDEHRYDDVPALVDLASKIKKMSNGQFYVVDGVVMIDNEKLPEALSKRLISFADADLPCDALVQFWENLKENPSAASVEQLYGFLEHNGIPITEDGCFIAYKAVTRNNDGSLVDSYTRTISNDIGKVVTMDREKVDSNPNQTCSCGLHVAAYRYAKFSYGGDVMLEVKVNPRDVVAVPTDYNNEKMRTCQYEVVKECEGEIDRPLYEAPDADVDDLYDPDDITSASPDTVEVTVKNTSDRVAIPKSIIEDEMGLGEGDTVDVVAFNGFLRVQFEHAHQHEKGIVEIRTYMVDKSNTVRVTASLFDVAGIGSKSSYKVVYCTDTGCVIVK